MKRKGIALITVLIMVSVLTMMVVGLYASVRGGLLSASVQSRRVAAQYVAEAGLAETMETLRAGGFALTSGVLTGSASTGGSYRVEFRDTPPFGEYDSVNNLTNGAYAQSHRGPSTVPPGTALIVVRAEVDGVERVLEAVVSSGGGNITTDNAIQASGEISLSGDVVVTGLQELGETTTVPGNIHSNSPSGTSVSWDSTGGATALITGDVGALGGTIDLSGYTPGGGTPTIGNSAAFPRPNILGTVSAHTGDPAPSINAFGTTVLGTGDFYQSGDLVLQGDLELDGGVLHVDGDLQVNGSISGQGTIFVAGETQFRGDAVVSADPDRKVALMSHGSVTLSGFDGNQFLSAMAATDPTFAANWADLQMVVGDLQNLVNSQPLSAIQGSGAHKVTVDAMRRSIGQTNPGPTHNGTANNLAGILSASLQAQGPSATRNFLIKKLDNISGFYEGVTANPVAAAAKSSGVSPYDYRQMLIDEWKSNPASRDLGMIGIFDAVIDNGDDAVMKQLVNITNQVDYDRLGASYFQGLVYTNGYVHAENEVSIVGGLMASGDLSLPTATINGQTVRPGDLVLDNGVRVTFIEEFFDGQNAGISIAGGGSLGVETWLGR